jgi:hypothetical protein
MSTAQREALTVLSRSWTATRRQVKRATVLLLAADGAANLQIAATVGVTRSGSGLGGPGTPMRGLAKFSVVRGGRGRRPEISPEKVQDIVRLTQHEKPSGATHWSCWSTKNRAGTTTSDDTKQATTTSDDTKQATTTVFAALNALDGTMIGSRVDEHRFGEFL